MSKTSYARAQAQIKSKLLSGKIERLHAIKELYNAMPDLTRSLMTAKKLVDEWKPAGPEPKPQRQDSLTDQMKTVIQLADANGCYDASDWIKKRFEGN